jgi:hypothetical protein
MFFFSNSPCTGKRKEERMHKGLPGRITHPLYVISLNVISPDCFVLSVHIC